MLDFKKVLNFVNRSILSYKLINSGIGGKATNVLKNTYTKIMARIKIGNWLYEWLQDESRTNQGGPLSLTMFHEMLNDVEERLDEKYCVGIDSEEIRVYMV